MELKEGMYVRYTRGAINGNVPPRIARITDCEDNELIKIDKDQVILRSDVIKASDNIIGLIEEGDYVNGCLVIKDIKGELRFIDNEYRVMRYVKNNEIKSIVTKEQFEAMKYVIKENKYDKQN